MLSKFTFEVNDSADVDKPDMDSLSNFLPSQDLFEIEPEA